MMDENQVYIGLGSNLGDSVAILRSTLEHITAIPHTSDLHVSSFYKTPPISDIPQPHYLNGVCRFKTSLPIDALFSHLQQIEAIHGRTEKHQFKNAPRRLDLDILFYGDQYYPGNSHNLEIPHPRWNQRLFVLIPLLELTPTINVPNATGYATVDIAELIQSFPQTERDEILSIGELFLPKNSEETSCIRFV